MLRGECCCCDCGEKKPQQQPQRPMVNGRPAPPVQRGGEDTPFVPPVPSWDTPQRPGFGGYAPTNDASGTFLGLGGHLLTTAPAVLDTGEARLLMQPRFDHQAGKIYAVEIEEKVATGLNKASVQLPAMYALVQFLNTPEQAKPHDFKIVIYSDMRLQMRAINLQEHKNRGLKTATYYNATIAYKDGTSSRTSYGVSLTRGSVITADFDLLTTIDDKEVALKRTGPFELVTRWIGGPNDPRILRERSLTMKMVNPEKPDWRYWFTDMRFTIGDVDRYNQTPDEWGAEYPGQPTTIYTPIDLLPELQLWGPPDPAPPRAGQRTFTSPDGAVFVQGKDTDSDPANLKEAELTAYGQTLVGGTWTALRDNPQLRKDGSWDYSPVIVLHEKGDVVTALRPDGSRETTTRAKFARESLRIEPDKFERFSSGGLGQHSWPPQWADAGGEGAAVAMVAHDGWRDNVKHPPTSPPAPPLPAGWVWTGRPPKRPKIAPKAAPRPPLGISLAGAQPSGLEALKKGQGPLDLPIKVEVKDDKGTWQPSPAGLKALAKRMLYQPAGWPEELSDGTSISKAARVTFATTDERMLLWLRLKVSAEEAPTLKVDGVTVALLRLGHNAPEKRGTHPYLAEIVTPLGDDGQPKKTLTLEFSGRLSRLLKLNTKAPEDS